MATTTITVASFKNEIAECADAILAHDFATASVRYAAAEAINAGLELEGSAGNDRLRRRDSLTGLKTAIAAAKQEINASTREPGFIRTRTAHPT